MFLPEPPIPDPLWDPWLPDPDPFGPVYGAGLDPLDGILSGLESSFGEPPLPYDDGLVDTIGEALDWAETSLEPGGLGQPPSDLHADVFDPLTDFVQADLDVLDQALDEEPGQADALSSRVGRVSPLGGHTSSPGLPGLDDGSASGPAHHGLLPPCAWDRRVGTRTGARSSSVSKSDDDGQQWCLRQHMIVLQEECAECEYGDDPDGSGHYFCGYHLDPDEEDT